MNSDRAIEGKTVLVTGANRGLGAALVAALLERGAAKVYCAARDPAKLEDVLSRWGGRTEAIRLDVTDASQIAAAARRLTELDILISNAGVTYMTPFKETTIEHARLVMETNFFGPLQLMYAFGETLSRRKGGYIYILSLAGLIAAQGAEVYSASKAAGAMVGHGLRGAFPDVAVSLVYPGLMDTDMMASATLKKTSPEEVGSRTLDGWLAGELSVFPDLHAEFTRDAFVSQGADILADPPQVMRAIIERYISVRGL